MPPVPGNPSPTLNFKSSNFQISTLPSVNKSHYAVTNSQPSTLSAQLLQVPNGQSWQSSSVYATSHLHTLPSPSVALASMHDIGPSMLFHDAPYCFSIESYTVFTSLGKTIGRDCFKKGHPEAHRNKAMVKLSPGGPHYGNVLMQH